VDIHIGVGSRHAGAMSSPHEGTHAELPPLRLLAVGVVAGLTGGIALAAPVVIWDWIRTGHRALELPMAATAWLFGLTHFSDARNLWWPIVIGAVLLAAYWAVSGVAFASLADRFLRVSRPGSILAAGAAWSFVSFIFFWYMLLPIARAGVPFRASAGAGRFTAPDWTWILGFTLFGLVTALWYATMRSRPALLAEGRIGERSARLHHAA
jgi:hypothetical protein